MNTIYIPKGKAKEYGDYALNIYNNCPHGCVYCFVPSVLKKDREQFHRNYEWRDKLLEETEKWFEKHPDVKGKHIHLCFTCDPFPYGSYDYMLTYQIIKLIHRCGNFVQILTKGELDDNDIALLWKDDIFGTTISCGDNMAKTIEPNALIPTKRLWQLEKIKAVVGCKTFVSCEPVFESDVIYGLIKNGGSIDEFKIGKLNYMAKDNPLYPNIDWAEFGRQCEYLCQKYNRKYYIKESLRSIMGDDFRQDKLIWEVSK
jgi:DNA repair photolyase